MKGLVLLALSSSDPILPSASWAFRAKGHGLSGSMENHTRTPQHAPLPLNAPPLSFPFVTEYNWNDGLAN